MNQIENLLSRLAKVKGRNGNFTACCPAHDDKTPSLAVKEQDGKIILHCFSGCPVENIVGAIGLDMTDLFPPSEKQDYGKPAARVKFFATDVLRAVAFEAAIVSIAGRDMARGKKLPKADLDRLQLAYERINSAMEVVDG